MVASMSREKDYRLSVMIHEGRAEVLGTQRGGTPIVVMPQGGCDCDVEGAMVVGENEARFWRQHIACAWDNGRQPGWEEQE